MVEAARMLSMEMEGVYIFEEAAEGEEKQLSSLGVYWIMLTRFDVWTSMFYFFC